MWKKKKKNIWNHPRQPEDYHAWVLTALPFWERFPHALPHCNCNWVRSCPHLLLQVTIPRWLQLMVEYSLTADYLADILRICHFFKFLVSVTARRKIITLVSTATWVLLSPTTNSIAPQFKEKRREREREREVNQRWTRYGATVSRNCCLNPSLAWLVDSLSTLQTTNNELTNYNSSPVLFFPVFVRET